VDWAIIPRIGAGDRSSSIPDPDPDRIPIPMPIPMRMPISISITIDLVLPSGLVNIPHDWPFWTDQLSAILPR